MAGRQLINAKGNVVSNDRVEVFRTGFRGEVIRPGDPAYDTARRIWNAIIDKHPGIIARCSGVADVVAALNNLFAPEADSLAPDTPRRRGHGARLGCGVVRSDTRILTVCGSSSGHPRLILR